MSFWDIFKKPRVSKYSTWKEFGTYQSVFNGFGTNIYRSDIVRSCIRPLAEHSSKAQARCNNKQIERILNDSPNMYMNGKDFLAKVRTRLELQNTVFIYISRDKRGFASNFYPVPYQSFKALDYNGNLFIQFDFSGGKQLTASWEDLAVIRKDYNTSDIAGDSNDAIYSLLELVKTTNDGIANAVKATANLRGILKNTKGMLSPDDIKKQKDNFVKDYLNLENEGGIASLDSTQEFTPLNMSPVITSYAQQKEFRENIYRYYGVSDAIVMSNYNEAQMDAFYDSRIEPFLIALSLELTRKCFTERERAFGSKIYYESNRMLYSNNSTKLDMVKLVDRGALTPNEWRALFSLDPIEGGDEPIRRLDTEVVNEHNDEASAEAEANEQAEEIEEDNNGD